MAKTYYKYAKRETTPVDYAGAAKGLSEGLMATVTGLEKKAEKAADEVAAAKSKIDEEFKKEQERRRKETEATDKALGDKIGELSKLPISTEFNYQSVQSRILDLAADSADWKLQLKRDYDAGKMTTKEYNRRFNNIDDQFKMIKQSGVTMMDMVKSVNEGVENGTSLPAEQVLLKEMLNRRFDNPNMAFNIDQDGNMIGELTNDDGTVSKLSVYEMNKMSLNRFPTFDIDSEVTTLVSAIGKELESRRGSGMTIEQLLENEPMMVRGNEKLTPNYYIQKTVNGFNSNKLASILQMKMDKQYDVSFNPAAFGDDNTVVYEINPTSGMYEAKLTPAQEEAAKEFATASVLLQLNPLKDPKTSTTATERKAAEERTASIRTARTNVTNLRKIFEGKSPAEVNQALSTYNKQLKKVATDADGEFIRAQVSGEGNERKIEVVYRNKFGDIISEKVADIPENFQDFVDAAGTTITGDRNLLTLREEAMAEIDDPSALTRGDEGGKYEVTVVEEQLPSIDTDATLSDAMDAVESQLDSFSYFNMGNAYSDMSTAAEDMFEKMGFEDYNITRNGDILTISIPEYGSLDFNMNKSAYGDDHDNRRGAFKRSMQSIYEALTTGKKMGGGGKPEPAGAKLSFADWKSQNPNGTFAEYNQYKNQ